MKLCVRLALVACILSAIGSQGFAQQREGGRRGGQGFGGGNSLLLVKSVQDDLRLTDDQIARATKVIEEQRGSFRDLQNLSQEERIAKLRERGEATQKALGEILTADQQKRLKQIGLQMRGTEALGDEETATALNLSADQKDKIRTIRDEARAAMRAQFENRGQGGDREEQRKKFEEQRTATQQKLTAVLTAEQQATWKSLQGEPFKGELPRFGGGFGGQRRGEGAPGEGGPRRRPRGNSNNNN